MEFYNVGNTIVHQLIISSVSNSHSARPDNISPSIIRILVGSLTSLLTMLFNNCMKTSMFSENWAKSNIKPLSKINLPKSLSDTRSIANLCELSKLFGRIIHKQIISYMNKNDIWDPYQIGFRKFFSTQSALLILCHDVRLAADKRRITILVLFDFSKAFDMVFHRLFLEKLARNGFSAASLRFIYSYLTNRI